LTGFTDAERSYLSQQRLGRLATVDAAGQPHVVPVGVRFDAGDGTLAIGAADLPGRGQRRHYLRNIETDPRVAVVIDDLASLDPFHPRGVSIRGRAEIVGTGGERLGPGFGPLWVRVTPVWISSWGIESGPYDPPHTRSLSVEPLAG